MEKTLETTHPELLKNLFSTWFHPLKSWGCIDLLDGLFQELDLLYENSIVFPKKARVFRAFNATTYNNCKAVLLGQDPYPNIYNNEPSACGLAFVTENDYYNPSLKRMIQELDADMSWDRKECYKYNRIKSWAKEGVLMLNTALTVEKGNPGSHTKLWQEWTKRLIFGLSQDRPDIVWILLGGKAQNFKIHMPSNVLTVEAAHPSPMAGDRFKGSKIYSRTNEILKSLNKEQISW